MLDLEVRRRTNRQKTSPLPCSRLCPRLRLSWYPAKARTEGHAGGCLCLPRGCLVPVFALASTSTVSPLRATCPRASLLQFPTCILPVPPLHREPLVKYMGPTVTGTRAERSSLEIIPATPALAIFPRLFSPLRFSCYHRERQGGREG